MTDPTTTLDTDFRTHLVAVDRHTELLLATARSLDPDRVGDPSLCPGWTRGHILSHIARNADALLNLVTNATTGSSTPMYASPESRDADIEAGARRPLAEQVGDVEASAARFASAASGLTEELVDVPLLARNNTKVQAGYLPFMRLREVVLHHLDLDAGFGFADVDDQAVLALLQDTIRRLRHDPETPSMSIRTNEGDVWSIGDGRPIVSGTRAAVLAWLTRGITSGVEGPLPTIPSLG
ncbi:MAG: maleylpyruvate isomerase family mycothiol-dependent enzyme [Lapillicoccus sp.]